MTANLDVSTWTYGMEIEQSDFRPDSPTQPLVGFYIGSEPASVNSDGSACGYHNPVGGEVNTWPTSTPEGQAEAFRAFRETYPTAAINYRSCVDGHIHVPGLREDLGALKAVVRYGQEWTPWVLERTHGIDRGPRWHELEKPIAAKASRVIFNWTTEMPKDWRAEYMLAAADLDEFWRAFGRTKSGGYTPLQVKRYAVNLYKLRHIDTVEFRHFHGADTPAHVLTVAEYMREFMYAALVTGEPMDAIFARMPHWQFPPRPTVDIDLERGYYATEMHASRATPKYVLAGEKRCAGSAQYR